MSRGSADDGCVSGDVLAHRGGAFWEVQKMHRAVPALLCLLMAIVGGAGAGVAGPARVRGAALG